MVPSRARRSTISSWSLTSPSFFVLDVRSLGPDADDDGAAPFVTLANSAVGVMVSGEPPGGDPRSLRGGSGVPLMSRDARGETGGDLNGGRPARAFKTFLKSQAEKDGPACCSSVEPHRPSSELRAPKKSGGTLRLQRVNEGIDDSTRVQMTISKIV